MRRLTNNSNDLLDVALDTDKGEIIIGKIRLRPVGIDSDSLKIRQEDSEVVFDAIVRFRDEAWRWRHWAKMYQKWLSEAPSVESVYRNFHK